MNIEQLFAVINHPATKVGMAMLMLAAPYINNEIDETEVCGIPARNIIYTCAAIPGVHGLVGLASRFFPNGINLRLPIRGLEYPDHIIHIM